MKHQITPWNIEEIKNKTQLLLRMQYQLFIINSQTSFLAYRFTLLESEFITRMKNMSFHVRLWNWIFIAEILGVNLPSNQNYLSIFNWWTNH